jgi:hypothetical protein
MNGSHFSSEVYTNFAPLLFDLIGSYEYKFSRDPKFLVKDYDKVLGAVEVLPLYGPVKIPNYIMYLEQLPVINRLREIRQLSHTHYIFPGANHSRYEHSLGVMYRSERIFNNKVEPLLKQTESSTEFEDDDAKVLLNVSSFLHDIGHPAWGHALDGITGYVIKLLKEENYPELFYFSPKKLDNTIAEYLILNNHQLTRSLDEISLKEISGENVRLNFKELVAQIIIEEETPGFEWSTDKKTTEKIDERLNDLFHLMTTIIGTYKGRGGINTDRLDWFPRDLHHAFIASNLDKEVSESFKEYSDRNLNDDFQIKLSHGGYLSITDERFDKLKEDLREKLYGFVYEGPERAFSDAILSRIAYSALRILDVAGSEILSPSIVSRAVMGYLLTHDYLMKETSEKILSLGKRNIDKLEHELQVEVGFISRSYSLLNFLDYISYVMHNMLDLKDGSVASRDMRYKFAPLGIIDGTILLLGAKEFCELINRAWKDLKLSRAKVASLLQQHVFGATRINSIQEWKLASLEEELIQKSGIDDIYLLMNYYYFRVMDDNLRKEIHDIGELLHAVEKIKNVPVMFLLCPEINVEKQQSLVAILHDLLIDRLIAMGVE